MTDEELRLALLEVARELGQRLDEIETIDETADALANLVQPRGTKSSVEQEIACSMVYAAREAVVYSGARKVQAG